MKVKIFDTNLARKDSFQVTCTGLAGSDDGVEISKNLDGSSSPLDRADITNGVMEILAENCGQGNSVIKPKIISYIVKNHYLPKFQKIAEENGYQHGWIFYQIKNKFGFTVASEICTK